VATINSIRSHAASQLLLLPAKTLSSHVQAKHLDTGAEQNSQRFELPAMLPASAALLDTESNHWQQPITQHNCANQGAAATAGKNA